MKKSKALKIGYLILVIVCISVVVLICGLVVKFTNGFTTGFQQFYITANNQDYIESGNGFRLKTTEPTRVDVKYVFGKFDKELTGYEVEIKSIGDFRFTADGKEYDFNTVKLDKAFAIDRHEDYFTIQPIGGIADIIKTNEEFAKSNIELPADLNIADIFKLTVYSHDKSSKVEVKFGILPLPPVEITLSKTEIVF